MPHSAFPDPLLTLLTLQRVAPPPCQTATQTSNPRKSQMSSHYPTHTPPPPCALKALAHSFSRLEDAKTCWVTVDPGAFLTNCVGPVLAICDSRSLQGHSWASGFVANKCYDLPGALPWLVPESKKEATDRHISMDNAKTVTQEPSLIPSWIPVPHLSHRHKSLP